MSNTSLLIVIALGVIWMLIVTVTIDSHRYRLNKLEEEKKKDE